MMKSIVAGQCDHSSPTVWHIKEDLYCGVIPHLYINNASSWNRNCAPPSAYICCVVSR